jgi:hypothetical protein
LFSVQVVARTCDGARGRPASFELDDSSWQFAGVVANIKLKKIRIRTG